MPKKALNITKARITEALRLSHGKIGLAADILKISVRTMYNRLDQWRDLREIIEENKLRRIDIAESKLEQAVIAGEPWAIRYLLDSQAKDRGYGQTVKVDGGLHNKSETVMTIRIEDVEAEAMRVMAAMDRMAAEKALMSPEQSRFRE